MPPVSDLVAPKCPNCGAPLQLLPDHTCSWCHSPVAVDSPPPADATASDTELDRQEALAFDAAARTWTLRPDGPQIDWSAGVASEGTISRRLLDTAHEGLSQPAAQELVADPDLDRDVCAAVADAMTFTRQGPLCDLVEALAAAPDSEPAWAERARGDVRRVRDLIADRQKMAARLHVTQDDETPPPALGAWVAEKLANAPKRRHHWR